MYKIPGTVRFVLFTLFVCAIACGVAAWISLSGGHSFGTPEFAKGQTVAFIIGFMAAVMVSLIESAE